MSRPPEPPIMSSTVRSALLPARLLLLTAILLAGARPAPAHEEPPKPQAPTATLDATTRDYHQRHLTIRVQPDMKTGTVEGSVTIDFESLADPLQSLRLHSRETTVTSVTGADGKPLTFESKDGILTVRLAGPLAAGATSTVTINYRSTPTRGLYFHRPTAKAPSTPWLVYSQGQGNDNRHWIPCYDEPDDRCTWEVHARVPAEMETVGNGMLASSTDHPDGTRTDLWKFEHRSPTYLISLVVSKFETVSKKYGDVLVEYHGPPGRRAELEFSLGDTPGMIDFFSTYAGRYPFPRYAQTYVWDFVYGGMENTTATTLNMRALHGPEVRPNYTSVPLVAHELAHMWFGDLLTCRTWDHIWLNEGFATYFTDLWYEHDEGPESFLLRRRDQNRQYHANTPHPEELGLTKSPRGDLPLELHGGKQYSRGAAILHMLRREIGDDAFRTGIQRYVKRFADRCVSSEDLRRTLEEVAGRDLKWFFDQWVYGAGYPVFEVARDGRRLVVKQVQARKGGQDLFRMTVPVRWGATGDVVPVSLYRERHVVTLPEPKDGAAATFVRFGVGGDLVMNVKLEQDLASWSDALAKDPDLTGRIDAAEALEEYGPDAVEVLARASSADASWAVRKATVDVLSRIETPEATAAVVAAATDPDARVREGVMLALGRRTRADAGAAVKRAAESDAHPYVRAEAARSLGRLKVEGAFETLQALLEVDAHESIVRAGALEGLRHLGDPRGADLALPFLDYEWGRGGTHRVRQTALDTRTALQPDCKRTQAELLALLDDRYHNMRSWAAEACGKYGIQEAADRLKVLAEKDWHDGVKAAAKTALERLAPKK